MPKHTTNAVKVGSVAQSWSNRYLRCLYEKYVERSSSQNSM